MKRGEGKATHKTRKQERETPDQTRPLDSARLSARSDEEGGVVAVVVGGSWMLRSMESLILAV